MRAVGGFVVLLGIKQLGGDGLSPLVRAPAAAMPQGYEHAGGGPQLTDGEVGIFFPHAAVGTQRGTDG